MQKKGKQTYGLVISTLKTTTKICELALKKLIIKEQFKVAIVFLNPKKKSFIFYRSLKLNLDGLKNFPISMDLIISASFPFCLAKLSPSLRKSEVRKYNCQTSL